MASSGLGQPLHFAVNNGCMRLETTANGSMQIFSCFLLLICAVWQSQASFPPGTVLDIQLSDVVFEQFSYLPTRQGYEYAYALPNGMKRNETGVVLHDGSPKQDLANAANYARNARPSKRPGVKNRKLSPKSLSSLAG